MRAKVTQQLMSELIRNALTGESDEKFSKKHGIKAVKNLRNRSGFSREAILRALAEGRRNDDIAAEMFTN